MDLCGYSVSSIKFISVNRHSRFHFLSIVLAEISV